MAKKIYTTKQIADLIGVHVNTVRLYEDIGFMTKPERKENGYRIYTELHLEQCRLIRLAMKAEVIQNGLRKQAIDIVKRCAACDFDGAISASEKYLLMIEREKKNAASAIQSVEDILKNRVIKETTPVRRSEAAKMLNVTSETLRTWERSGLIRIKRNINGYRVYTAEDMTKLNIIRTLRCANYSLSSILRLFNQLDKRNPDSVETILNTPSESEDIVSVCDRLLISLEKTSNDALEIKNMLVNIKQKFKPSIDTPYFTMLL